MDSNNLKVTSLCVYLTAVLLNPLQQQELTITGACHARGVGKAELNSRARHGIDSM